MVELSSQPATPPPGVRRPHGCLTALIVGFVLTITAGAGTIWLNTLLQPDATVIGISAAVYGLGLIVPFGLAAVLLRGERFWLWRGIALALALAGGHAGLTGGLLAVDLTLRWPGLPATLPTVITLLYTLIVIFVGRKRFFAKPSARWLLLSIGMGALVSLAWGVVGALGTIGETLIGVLEALASGLLNAVLLRTIFLYDGEFPAERPFWSALLAAGTFAALLPAQLAVRGYWMQGDVFLLSLWPLGLIGGALLVSDRPADLRRQWWVTLTFFVIAFLFPFTLTEGFEGDWMIDEMAVAWGGAILPTLALGIGLSVALLAMRQWVLRLAERRLAIVGIGVTAWMLAGGLYAGLGQPGLQPDSFFVVMVDQADTSFARSIPDRTERYRAVYETLTKHALETQADLRAFLDARGVTYTPYYLVNGIEVETFNPLLRYGIASRPDVARILNSPHTRPLPHNLRLLDMIPSGNQPSGLSWGVDAIDAEQVWEQFGVTGEGIIIGHADSGVDWRHPALRSQYLGEEDNHNYTWFDPWYGTDEPTDGGGHGTHTLGTILGQGGIGVAPDARWIACRNLARNLGNPPYYLDCMQFLLAPFPQGGDPFRDGDPTRGAHLTSNSWGCPPQEGCDGLTLSIAVEHLRNAGQMFIVGAGNEGPACSTVDSPASADAAFTVGAFDAEGRIADFSSRGPVLIDGSGRIKPDIAAPGVDVLSSLPGGRYAPSSGTSMATPHVAGVVALMWSANPTLIGDIDTTEAILARTAHHVPAPDLCGGDTGAQNNVYGFGRIDALAAVREALEVTR